MIKSYTDHSANERTFLAWLRTGVAIIAFGFLIDRFDLFVITMADAVSTDPERRAQLEAMSSSLGHGTGLSFILVGLVFIVAATIRFQWTRSRLLDKEIHQPGFVMEVALAAILAILIVVASIPLVFGSL